MSIVNEPGVFALAHRTPGQRIDALMEFHKKNPGMLAVALRTLEVFLRRNKHDPDRLNNEIWSGLCRWMAEEARSVEEPLYEMYHVVHMHRGTKASVKHGEVTAYIGEQKGLTDLRVQYAALLRKEIKAALLAA